MSTPASAQPRPPARAPVRPQRTPVHARGHAALAKTTVLVEALPWLSRFQGTTVVIKYGGNAMTEPALREAFAADVGFLRYAGIRVVVVHGGGPQITAHLDRLGMPSRFAAGLRITDQETMEIVRMVLVGQVNRDIVGLVNDHGPIAVGLSGEDANLFTARRRTAVVDGAEVDLGRVGEIVEVQPGTVHALLATGKVPVVASVARGIDGGVYNVNADTAAAALAEALGAAKLVVLTDVEGLYADWPDSEELISELAADELEQMMPSLSSGMIPKMEACLHAVRGGVPQAHVLDGRVPHAVLLEVFTDDGIGTLITPDAGDLADVAGEIEVVGEEVGGDVGGDVGGAGEPGIGVVAGAGAGGVDVVGGVGGTSADGAQR